ncbi:hypothetical protein [Candidatus Nanoperiomorbus periodonticus]|uniref:hypothetical protein n=1 Tax=Candidatus Nanoperiomorbus periodonticus TaxID=2171989 RepID=UPI00101CB513|nr:hypothetical protein [Candidatus Nanoperiomorbus periodonticus]RYC74615.1 hypothetical protein G52EAM_00707 [Candidatus Nanoperiomorbus periodonticus]RYC75668.1 hypothetical protein G51EAM_00620 [Candidatus Nanoperiomorbus periodonticus]
MMEFIKLARRRGVVADLIHVIFNVIFAGAAIYLTIAFESLWPAVVLVILSKWRVLAVRPRYWRANFLSSLPDLIFGIGLVTMSWGCGRIGVSYLVAGEALPVPALAVQISLGVIYSLWLIVIKPRHGEAMIGFQALASQFVGVVALFLVAQGMPLTVFLVIAFIIAFASARQALGMFEEKSQGLLATIWGLLVMELAFVSWHWSVFYLATPLIRIPQLAIILSLISVTAFRVYRAWQDDRRVTWDELGAPVVLTVVTTLVMLFAFSGLF